MMEEKRPKKYWHAFWLIFLIGGCIYFFILDPQELPSGLGYTIGVMLVPTTIGATALYFSKHVGTVKASYIVFVVLIIISLANRINDSREDIVGSYIAGCKKNSAVSAYYPDSSTKAKYCSCVGESIATEVLVDGMVAKALLRDRNADFVSGGIESLVNGAAEQCMASISP